MALLLVLSDAPINSSVFDAALLACPHDLSPATASLVDYSGAGYRFAINHGGLNLPYLVYTESGPDSRQPSFVYVLGWCYRPADTSSPALAVADCPEILRRHQKGLPPASDDLSGNYLLAVYDAVSQRLAIQPDHWAMSSLYFARAAGISAVSDRSIPPATLTAASFDGYSLLSLSRGMHMPFGRSLFSGVSRVMCGCYLDIDLGAARFSVRRAYPLYRPATQQSFSSSVDAVADTLCAVARRLTLEPRSVFDLTGGNDTRLLAAAVAHEYPIGFDGLFTWRVAGPPDHPDVLVATQVARACGWPLIRLDQPSPQDTTPEELQRAAIQSDGTCLIDTAFSRLRQERSSPMDFRWLVGSIGGELLRGFFWRHELLSLWRATPVNFQALLRYRLADFPGVLHTFIRSHTLSPAEHDDVVLAPYEQIDRAGGPVAKATKLDIMYLHKLCYSSGNSHSWLRGIRNIKLPLVSWEVTRVSLALPWRIRVSRRLVLHAIKRLSPTLGIIPNDKGEPMVPLLPASLLPYLRAGMDNLTKTMPRVTQRYLGWPSRRGMSLRNVPPDSWTSLLTHSRYTSSIFDRADIQTVSDKANSSTASLDWLTAFYTMLSMELLIKSTPGLRPMVTFTNGPEITP